jgi:two-component system chemotaxis response regulator CheB
MMNVLIVEDSMVARELLVHILDSDPEIHIIGTASNGEEALKILKTNEPDVITMDISMPIMNGFEATRRIMETQPVPIVIVTASWDPEEVATSFRAIEAGAVALMEKPTGVGHPGHENEARELVRTVKLMSEVKVVKRTPRLQLPKVEFAAPAPMQLEVANRSPEIGLVAIGVSTGGPPVLKQILSGLPKSFPVPILIVQHIAQGFLQGMAVWLEKATGLPFHIPVHGEYLFPGHVYLAPEALHMGVVKRDRVVLSDDGQENGTRPSISYLFRSVLKTYGQKAVGVLLTGMGRDGAEELKLMKEKGAVTIVQDKESSVVFGMPGEAIKLDAAHYVLPPEGIAAKLNGLVTKKGGRD